jgi:hypothetical protein
MIFCFDRDRPLLGPRIGFPKQQHLKRQTPFRFDYPTLADPEGFRKILGLRERIHCRLSVPQILVKLRRQVILSFFEIVIRKLHVIPEMERIKFTNDVPRLDALCRLEIGNTARKDQAMSNEQYAINSYPHSAR